MFDYPILATNHQAVTSLQSPDATARSYVHVMDSLRRELLGAPNIVDVIGIAAIDQDVVRLETRQELVDSFAHHRRRDHQPDRPGLREFPYEIAQRGGGNCLLFSQLRHGRWGHGLHPTLTPVDQVNENFSFLRNPANRTDFWDPFKYVPLDQSGNYYLTLWFENRSEYEWFQNEMWGQGPQTISGYWLQRIIPAIGLTLGSHVRVYTSFQYEKEMGNNAGPRPARRPYRRSHVSARAV